MIVVDALTGAQIYYLKNFMSDVKHIVKQTDSRMLEVLCQSTDVTKL